MQKKILLIEDERSGYSMKRYVAHLKKIDAFDFSVFTVHDYFSTIYVPIFKYLILPFKVFFAKESSIIIPTERYAYLLWFWRGEKSVVVCHDLHDLMNYDVPFYLKCFIRLNLSGLTKATKIVTVSEHTQVDLLKYKPTLDRNKMAVIHNAIEDHWFTSGSKSDFNSDFTKSLPDSYVLMVGTNAWYKNIDWGLRIINELNISLVKVGVLSEQQINFLNTNKISYTHYQNVKEVQLKYLYSNASFLFFPSIHEGFGWPVLEAMASSCPILASNKASIPEIGEQHIQYIDLNSIERTHQIIKEYLDANIQQDKELNRQRAKSFNFERFSSSFKELLNQ
ncbi:glycosyltransferase [Marivirga harenae]|uniref:glycosyltransferase n=1 Tax=Marivirga harenae TaxID=2010992 RepID=UPI0026E0E9DF|nr:glycosyltransferase [Marivirga harenae]WKV11370.1 glycosyltransferase [Marivirga harenae]